MPPKKADQSNKAGVSEKLTMDQILKKINDTYGKGTIARAATARALSVPRIETGIFAADFIMGGGVPVGRITGIYGLKSAGKTLLALKTVASAQRYCREHLVKMKETKKKMYRCTECGYLGDKEGKICPDCTEAGFATKLADMGDRQLQCPECKKYNPIECVWIDAEGAWENFWAAKVGVNCHQIYVIRTEYAEQAIDISDTILRNGKCDLLVIDTLAHLIPYVEIEESASKWQVGLQARLINKLMRKLTSAQNAPGLEIDNRPTILLLNQVRMKVGIFYGCFHEDTPIMFADGTQPSIREVVNGKMPGPVLSWDGKKIVERRIVGWHNNGVLDEASQWLTFRMQGVGGRRGAMGFTCTPEHALVKSDGSEVSAKEVHPGDKLLSWFLSSLTTMEKQIICGSLFGDGKLGVCEGSYSAYFALSNSEQLDYLQWKMSLFTSRSFSRMESCGRVCFRTEADFELGLLRNVFYPEDSSTLWEGYRTIPEDLLLEASPLTLAVWFMDDGHYEEEHRHASISVKRLTLEHAKKVADILCRRGFACSYKESQRSIMFLTEGFRVFSSYIPSYVHPQMSFKLLPEHRKAVFSAGVVPEMVRDVRQPMSSEVIDVWSSCRKMRSKTKYDLTIEGNSFYLVGGDSRGIVVHNSPEVRPGGMVQEFATSVDIRMWPGKYTQDKPGNTLNMVANVRCVKNKVSPAQMSGNFRLWLRDYEGHKAGDTEDKAVVLGQAVKRGWFGNSKDGWTYLGQTFGSRKEVVKHLLTDNDAYEGLRTALFQDMLGTVASDTEALAIEEEDEASVEKSEEDKVVSTDPLAEVLEDEPVTVEKEA